MNYPVSISPASILCVGLGWSPLAPGGLNRYLYESTQQLAKDGDRIEFCGIDLPENSPHSQIRLTNLAAPDQSLPQRLWSTHCQFSQHQLRSLNAINLHFALYSLPLLKQLPKSVPVTYTFHGPWALEAQAEGESRWSVMFKNWIEQQVYQRCDRFIVLSKAFGKILHETYRIPWERIHVIPGGVDTTQFQANLSRQTARDRLNFPQDRPILFTPRRLVQRMGIDKLLNAMVEVKRVVPDVWLGIAGKGELRDSLEQQIQALNLEQNVKLLGYIPDEHLPIAYQAADLTVVPSQTLEGFGLILLESLASGTPVLCTPVGGMPEVISPFSSALLTETCDATAIADRLIDLLTDQISLPSRADCRAYACEQFDWQIIAPRIRQTLLNSSR